MTLTPFDNAPSPVAMAGSHGTRPPAQLPAEPGWAMFLDLDGTLCPYQEAPEQVRLNAKQRRLLTTLSARIDGALCVLSGRASGDLDRALGELSVLRCGEHGHDPSEALPVGVAQELHEAGAAIHSLTSSLAKDGVWLERKATSCAVHYRRAVQHEEELVHAMRMLALDYPLLRLMEGQCVIELASSAGSKGHALRETMLNAPFRNRIPVAVGDDATDEDAFIAAAALGGFGVGVGGRRSVAARYHLGDSESVMSWLQELVATSGQVQDA